MATLPPLFFARKVPIVRQDEVSKPSWKRWSLVIGAIVWIKGGEAGEIGDNVEVSLEYVFSFELEEEIVLLERVNEVC
jgi:hypothetical protein